MAADGMDGSLLNRSVRSFVCDEILARLTIFSHAIINETNANSKNIVQNH